MIRAHGTTVGEWFKWWWTNPIVILLVITCLVGLCFGGTLSNEFVQDDHIFIANPSIRSLSRVHHLFLENHWGPQPNHGSNQYRPLSNLTLALNFALQGENPFGYHLVNLGLYIGNCLLLYLIGIHYGSKPKAAFLAAVLFAVHPVHLEVIAPVFGRAELLTFAFCALAVLFHRRHHQSGTMHWWRIASWGAFFCGLLCKENAVVLPGILLLADYRANRFSRETLGSVITTYLGFAVTFLGYIGFRLCFFGVLSPDIGDTVFQNAPFATRFWTMCRGFVTYIRLLTWPRTLCADYDFSLIPLTSSPTPPAVLGLVLVLAIGVTGVILIGRKSWVGFGILMIFVSLSVVSNLPFPTGILIAERVLFLPSVGVCVIGAVLLEWMWNRGWRYLAGTTLGAVLVLAAIQDNLRNRDWRDDRAWLSALVRVAPNNPKGLMGLGATQEQDGRTAEAERSFRRAVEVAPDLSVTNGALGAFYLRRGRLAEARGLLEKSVELSKRYGQFYLDLGRLYCATGETARGLAVFQEGMDLLPRKVELHNECGTLFMADGRYADAEAQFRAALTLRGDDPRVLQNLALALQRQDKLGEALEFWEKLVGVEPRNPAAHSGLAACRLRRGEIPKAIAEFERARDLDPNSLEILNNLGIALARSGRMDEARAAFERALTIDPHYLPARRNLDRLAENRLMQTK